MAAEQLLVRAAFCDFAVRQNEDEVSLRQEAHTMGHKYAGLLSTPQQQEKKKMWAQSSAILSLKNKRLSKVVVSSLWQ